MAAVKYDLLETAAGHRIGMIKIARPEALNALNRQVMQDLKLLLSELAHKREIRAAILTGEGEKAFLHRFAAAGAAVRYRAVHEKEVQDIVALDVALRRNDHAWFETLPASVQAIERCTITARSL